MSLLNGECQVNLSKTYLNSLKTNENIQLDDNICLEITQKKRKTFFYDIPPLSITDFDSAPIGGTPLV